jgi:cell division protein FtsW
MMITRKNPFFFWFNSINKITFFSVLALIVIGVVLSFSLSYAASEKVGLRGLSFFAKHILFTGLAVCIVVFFSFQNSYHIKLFCVFGFLITLVLLVFVLFGFEIKGSRRWISLFGFSIQPSEILKPFYIYIFSLLFSYVQMAQIKKESTFGIFATIIILHALITVLLFLEPDFGMIITFNMLFVMLFYLNLKSIKNFFVGGLGVLIVAGTLGLSLEHVRVRLKTFFFGLESYQPKLAEEAIQGGGFFGKGFAESKLKFILPEAHNDFIFAILIEEFGFIFALILGLVFLLIIFANFIYILDFKQKMVDMFSKISYSKTKMNEEGIASFVQTNYNLKNGEKYSNIYFEFLFCRNFIFLTCILLFFEFFINASVSLNFVPTKGIAMPFISYGGSSLVAHGILIGILLSLNKKRYLFLFN